VGGKFDVIFLLFQSFGQFKNSVDDQRVLQNVFLALKSAGKFLIDLRNPDLVFSKIKSGNNAVFKPDYSLENGGSVQIKESIDDSNRWRWDAVWKLNDKTIKNYQSYRLYNLEEIGKMLKDTGFRIEKIWGDYTGEEYSPQNSKRIIILAYKPY